MKNLTFHKRNRQHDETVTVTMSRYLSAELLQKIAAHEKPNEERTVRGLTNIVSNYQWHSAHFSVIAKTRQKEVIGYAGFLQNQKEPEKWMYTDVWVDAARRREGIAKRMVNAGIEYLSDAGAKLLICTVDSENRASLRLQKSLGFSETPTEPFDEMFTDGLLMFRLDIPQNLSAVPLAADDFYIGFLCGLMVCKENICALHSKAVPDDGYKLFFQEMKASLQKSQNDADEQNFIIQKGIVPVAWLKVNGLDGETAWISMLVVHKKFKRLGIGSFAVRFAEDYAKSKGKTAMSIHTTADNAAAQSCYKKLGYKIIKEDDCMTGDGQRRQRLTLHKTLIIGSR